MQCSQHQKKINRVCVDHLCRANQNRFFCQDCHLQYHTKCQIITFNRFQYLVLQFSRQKIKFESSLQRKLTFLNHELTQSLISQIINSIQQIAKKKQKQINQFQILLSRHESMFINLLQERKYEEIKTNFGSQISNLYNYYIKHLEKIFEDAKLYQIEGIQKSFQNLRSKWDHILYSQFSLKNTQKFNQLKIVNKQDFSLKKISRSASDNLKSENKFNIDFDRTHYTRKKSPKQIQRKKKKISYPRPMNLFRGTEQSMKILIQQKNRTQIKKKLSKPHFKSEETKNKSFNAQIQKLRLQMLQKMETVAKQTLEKDKMTRISNKISIEAQKFIGDESKSKNMVRSKSNLNQNMYTNHKQNMKVDIISQKQIILEQQIQNKQENKNDLDQINQLIKNNQKSQKRQKKFPSKINTFVKNSQHTNQINLKNVQISSNQSIKDVIIQNEKKKQNEKTEQIIDKNKIPNKNVSKIELKSKNDKSKNISLNNSNKIIKKSKIQTNQLIQSNDNIMNLIQTIKQDKSKNRQIFKQKIAQQLKQQQNRQKQLNQLKFKQQQQKRLNLIPQISNFLQQNLQQMSEAWKRYDLMCWNKYLQLIKSPQKTLQYQKKQKSIIKYDFKQLLSTLQRNFKAIKITSAAKKRNFLILKYLICYSSELVILAEKGVYQESAFDWKQYENVLKNLQQNKIAPIYQYVQQKLKILKKM